MFGFSNRCSRYSVVGDVYSNGEKVNKNDKKRSSIRIECEAKVGVSITVDRSCFVSSS